MTPERDKTASSTGTKQSMGTRTGTTVAAIKQAILDNRYFIHGRIPSLATRNDWYMAVAFTVRDRMHTGTGSEYMAISPEGGKPA